jgi:MFS family permease
MTHPNRVQRTEAEALRRRWRGSLAIFFGFMLLHQTDRYLISPLTTPIMEAFGINEAQMGAVLTGAILVGAVFFPLWGYLYDRYARPRILAAASLIWGATTWLAALVPSYPLFVAARASTGIDDASYPGIYSMVSDLFGPERRGRAIATLQLAAPVSFIVATGLAYSLRDAIGWRGVFVVTGALGVVMAAVIRFKLRDVPRGASDPSLSQLAEIGIYRFNWPTARGLLRKPTLLLLFLQQFVHLFPFQAITFWFFRYLEVERRMSPMMIGVNSGLFVLVGIAGYLSAGALGDWAFRRTPRGRLLVGGLGICAGAILLLSALRVPVGQDVTFTVVMAATALLINYAHPNVVTTIQDVTEPEVRSTAHAMLGIAEQSGSALAPLLVGIIAVGNTLQFGMTVVCGVGFAVSSALLLLTTLVVSRDTQRFRAAMAERAAAR